MSVADKLIEKAEWRENKLWRVFVWFLAIWYRFDHFFRWLLNRPLPPREQPGT